MQWIRRCLVAPVLGMMAAFSAGCPAPVLDVSPDAVSFGSAQSTAELRINNRGSGTLNWEIQESLPWLQVESLDKQGNATGSTTTDTSVVELTVLRDVLEVGTTRGEITVVSNGGTLVVPVSVDEGGPAQLSVSTNALDFAATGTQQSFLLSNLGVEPLTWSVAIEGNPAWVDATPKSGTISSRNGTQSITVTLNRAALVAGSNSANLTVTSNGGGATIAITATVAPFSVTPGSLTFGFIQSTATAPVTVINSVPSPLSVNYSATTTDGANWITLERATEVIAGSAQTSLNVSANPAGLSPGDYTGVVSVTNPVSGITVNIPVSMSVSALSVSPDTVAFGTISSAQTSTFTVENLGGAAIPYNVTIPVEARSWLSVSPSGGNVSAADIVHTLTANPAAVDPGSYTTDVVVAYEGGQETVRVSMAKARPARLVVVSQQLNFDTTKVVEQVDIWNDGIGVINWSIDTTAFPAWLSLEGATNGSVQGEETDSITLRVDRSLAPAGSFEFQHQFTVVGSGAVSESLSVNVQMRVPQIPKLEIVADGVDNTGTPFINVDVSLTSKSFIIRNTGNGVLNWNFRPAEFPAWISSITPAQSGLDPNTQQTVTVTVDRTTLDFSGAQIRLSIDSNDPSIDGGVAPFIVEVQVPKRVVLIGRPSSLSFGPDESVGILEVANNGDPGTELLYRLRSTKPEWLKVFPDTGSSIGTESSLKDYKAHTVAIVRSELEGSGSSGKIIAEAIRTNELGQTEVVPEVTPIEFNVSVEAAELTFEHALPRLRVPSMVRFVMLMRNLRFAPIPIAETRLSNLASQIQILENDVPLELTETSKIAKGQRFIRGNMLVLLDYSNSMQEAARGVADADIANAPDPLQALYERTITKLIDEAPANYRVGLAIFSERSGTGGSGAEREALRPILGTAAEGPETEEELFLNDRDLLIERLQSIVVATNGATELYPAIRDASDLIVKEDRLAGIVPFEDVDDRILVCVTDGRATTPPGQVNEIIDQLRIIDRTRTLVIGWGEGVSTGPLVQLATETGGHVYSTNTEEISLGNGQTTERAIVSELENYCETLVDDSCDLSIKRDLESQFIFSYVTLNEENNVEIQGRLTFDDPNDQASPCLPEQGEIAGKFAATQIPLGQYAGDPRLAQIKLFSSNLPGGLTRVTAYLDGAARDIAQFGVTLGTVLADPIQRDDVRLVSRTDGGLISTWTIGGSGLNFTFTSPDSTPFIFGDFGPLFTVDITNASPLGYMTFDLTSPVYAANNPNGKYFTCPDAIYFSFNDFTATSFPRPYYTLVTVNGADPTLAGVSIEPRTDGSFLLNLAQNVNEFELAFYNLGGNHEPTDVGLEWLIIPNAQGIVRAPDDVDLDVWGQPLNYSVLDPQIRRFVVDRTIPQTLDGTADDTEFQIDFEYTFRGLGYEGVMLPLYLRVEITPPVANATPNALSFPDGVNQRTLSVSNDGQGVLSWTVNTDLFPDWLSIDPVGGVLEQGQTSTVNLFVNRAGQPSGTQTFSFDVVGGDAENPTSDTVTITLEVP